MDIGYIADKAPIAQQNVGQMRQTQMSTPPSQAVELETENAVPQLTEATSPEQVKQAVEDLNAHSQSVGRGLEFSVDSETDQTVVKVVDQNTKEIIRQIPSEEALAIAESLDKVLGSLLSEKA